MCSYESCIAWHLCNLKGAMLSSPPTPGSLVRSLSFFAARGGAYCVCCGLARLCCLACMLGVFVHGARACMLCLFLLSVGPSVGLTVCPPCLVFLLFVFFVFGGLLPFLFLLLFVLDYVMLFSLCYISLVGCADSLYLTFLVLMLRLQTVYLCAVVFVFVVWFFCPVSFCLPLSLSLSPPSFSLFLALPQHLSGNKREPQCI